MNEEENVPKEYIELADGTKLTMSAGYDGDRSLWMWEAEPGTYSLQELLAYFIDPVKTAVIVTHTGTEVANWTGFTQFASIGVDGYGKNKVRMMRPLA